MSSPSYLADDPQRAARFGTSAPFSLGVEEELFLADADSGRQLNAGPDVLAALGETPGGQVKGELHACQVELITDVCATVADAVGTLRTCLLYTSPSPRDRS